MSLQRPTATLLFRYWPVRQLGRYWWQCYRTIPMTVTAIDILAVISTSRSIMFITVGMRPVQ